MKKLLLTAVLLVLASPAWATTWMIGDNDGYGAGIADNANHNLAPPITDNRSAAEAAATNGAQFTDTYSTAHPGWSIQPESVAVFSYTGLGNNWSVGTLTVDMADFEASTYGPFRVDFNGILQNWAFNDGFLTTKIRVFELDANTIASINNLGTLTVSIDRNQSGDFYGIDFMCLADSGVADAECGEGTFTPTVPEPASLALLGLGLLGLAARRRRS